MVLLLWQLVLLAVCSFIVAPDSLVPQIDMRLLLDSLLSLHDLLASVFDLWFSISCLDLFHADLLPVFDDSLSRLLNLDSFIELPLFLLALH